MIRDVVRPKRSSGDLVRIASELWPDGVGSSNIGYYANMFAQTSLPYRDPGDNVPVWTRRNGDLTLRVQPGWTSDDDGNDVCVGYPSGVLPRLLMHWVSTEAVRTRSPELELGSSLTAFMLKLNLKPTGGKNGSITRLRSQAERLFRARVSIHFDSKTRQQGADLSIARAWDLGWTARGDDPLQGSLLPTTVLLTQDFFDRVVANPVPVDMAALVALRGSALRLDIYSWLTYRMSYLERPTTIPWELLRGQFGSQLADDRSGRAQFKRDFVSNLRQVLIVYPAARVEIVDSGIKLRSSPTHVSFRGLKELRGKA
jgi:hypothetical protein